MRLAPFTAFASLSMMHSDAELHEPARPAHIAVRKVLDTDLSASHSTVQTLDDTPQQERLSIEIMIPLFQLNLSKQTFDTLQFFVDDLAQYSQYLQRQSEHTGSRTFDSYDNKMIGSRFFGAKSYLRSHGLGSDSSDSGSREGSTAVTITLTIIDCKAGSASKGSRPVH